MNYLFLTVSAAVLLPWWISSASAAPAGKPNVVFILADDMGYADIGVQGCQDIPTPNIDRIASNGVRFTDAYANGAVCTPTRAALMTGRYQHRYGVEFFVPLPAVAKTMPKRLTEAGYATGMVGKWHLGGSRGLFPMDRGFDSFFGFLAGMHAYLPKPNKDAQLRAPIFHDHEPMEETRYLTDAFGDEAVKFIDQQRDATRPFFLYLAFNAVHLPDEATEKCLQRFPNLKNPRQKYAAMLSSMDDAIGQVLAKLEAVGKADNTLVIFSNDNGAWLTHNGNIRANNHPLRGEKGDTFEGGIRVPLLMQWPGVISPGSVYRQPVMSFDITATILAAGGAGLGELDGVDLLPFIKGKKQGSPHEILCWRMRPHANNYAVRQGDWKLVCSADSRNDSAKTRGANTDMLFNLAEDIGEQHDLAMKYPEKLAELKKRYEAWSTEVDADCVKAGLKPMQYVPGE